MKNVTVAIEFDEEMDDIISFTAELLSDKETDVHVVHVYESHSPLVDYAPYVVDPVQNYEDVLQKQADAVRHIVQQLTEKGVKAHGYMKPISKNVADSIVEFAGEKETELVIIGTHHPSRVERIILGNVAEKVIRHSSVPVVVIPRMQKQEGSDKE